jgi:hypothetical protein
MRSRPPTAPAAIVPNDAPIYPNFGNASAASCAGKARHGILDTYSYTDGASPKAAAVPR